MSTILYLAHTEADGTLAKISREALTAAHQLAAGMGAELAVGLVGEDVGAVAESVAGCKARFLGVSGDAFSQGRYASDLAAAEALFKAVNPDMVVAPASFRFSRAIPGLAVRVQGRVDTHLTGLEAKDGKPVAKRWFYRQRMVGEFSRDERPWIVTVDAGCFEAFEESGSADVELVQVSLPEMRTTVTGIQAPDADEQTIRPDAKTLLVAGAGWTKKQADGRPENFI